MLLPLLLTGCVEPLSDSPEATGTLILEIGSGSFTPATKAETAQDGYRFNNLLVLVINKAGAVVGDKALTFSDARIQEVIQFDHLPIGNYNVYAYANYNHTDWQAAGSTIDATHFNPDQLLKTLTGTTNPQAPTSTGMLLTGHKTFSVGVQQNTGRVELQRPVARFNVWVYNHTGYPVKLESLSFSNFNADRGYLLEHLDANGLPVVPTGTTYRSLPAYTGPVTIPAAAGASQPGEQKVYSQLLYESRGTDAYKMFARVTLQGESGNVTKDLVANGVELVSSDRILAMQTGDTMNVMLVNPNTNNGAFFGYNSNNNDPNTALHKLAVTVAPLSYQAFYEQYAEDILSSLVMSQYILTLKKTATGYRLLLKDTPYNLFNFQNVQLTDEVSVVAADVTTLDTSFPISSEFAGHLVHFEYKKGNATYAIYETSNSNRQNYGLYGNTASSANLAKGNRMWALYEVHPVGTQLKLIDNETHQVTPLTYIARNWDLNVVLNVYYGVKDVDLTFEVDNSHWSENHSSTSHHLFE